MSFETEAALLQFLQAWNAEYGQYAARLWQKGVRSFAQLANARDSTYHSAGVELEFHIDDLRAKAAQAVAVEAAAAGPQSAAGGLITSPDIATEMVAPLEGMLKPPRLQDLENVLDDQSGIRIPVTRDVYDHLASLTDPPTRQKLKVVNANIVSTKLGAYLLDGVVELHSEYTTTCTVQPLLYKVFGLLNCHSPFKLERFEFFGNCTEFSTSSSTGKKRSWPDMLGIVDAATMYVAEDKAHPLLPEALNDMRQYVKHGLVRTHYGSVDYILGHVAASPAVQFISVAATGEVATASSVFSLDSIAGRVSFLVTTMRVYKLLTLLRQELAPLECRTQPMLKPVVRGHTQVTLIGSGAVKIIRDFETFSSSHFVTQESVLAGYAAAKEAAAQMQGQQRAPFLVYADQELKFEKKRGNRVQYEVSTTPLGYSSKPSDEQELQSFAWACCKAAAILHAKHLVHRDFRVANVVRLTKERWLVIDLELCSYAPVVLPASYNQTDWTPCTIEHVEGSAHYTYMSDMRQIGVMLDALRKGQLTKEADDFISQLMNKTLTAEAALQHPWLRDIS